MIKKKSLGQNFLKSQTALSAIIEASQPTAQDIVLEIGPGEGVLTEKLLALAGKIVAVEKDRRLIPYLEQKFQKEIAAGKLEIIEKDILDFDVNSLHVNHYKIIANIPYYITGQILRMFLETRNQPQSMTLLLQKEVAERILARDKKESLLSLSVKAYGHPEIVRTVGRGAFSPQPNVDSAILNITDISQNNFKDPVISSDLYQEKFFEVIHAGFAHKRKQLFSNLADKFDKNKISHAFQKIGLDLKCRAEDLPLLTWLTLSKIL